MQQHKAKGLQAPSARGAPALQGGVGAAAGAAAGAPKQAPLAHKPGQAPAKPAGEQRLDPLGRPTQIDPEHQARPCA